MHTLNERVNASSYLSNILKKLSESEDSLTSQKTGAISAYIDNVNKAETYLTDAIAKIQTFDVDSFYQAVIEDNGDYYNASTLMLREHKREFAFVWSLAQMAKAINFQRLGQLQTDFAQATISLSMKLVLRMSEFKKYYGSDVLVNDILPGFFVLGLGKLGGMDLNFSSDVDLVAFYDKKRLPIDNKHGQQYAVSQILAAMTKLLDSRVNNEFVWRVDWRLRPDASVHYLTQSTHYAENFYHFHAQPWHRLALIKARIVAGDEKTGKNFLNDLESFLWRKNIDYRELDEIAQLKKKINLEHPKLKAERRHRKDEVLSEIKGFNVKLGSGGIREIEFIVNALQLLWGGKKPLLQETNTLQNLKHLAAENLLDSDTVEQLNQAYIDLRQLENCLQMLGNQQIHIVPSSIIELKNLCLLANESWDVIEQRTCEHRHVVSKAFNVFFASATSQSQEQFDKRNELVEVLEDKGANEETLTIIDYWFNGFGFYGVGQSQTQILKPLAVMLVERIAQSEVEVNLAIATIHNYFSKLPLGGQYLRMLQAQPHLLNKLITPLLLSPAMTVLLEQSPHIIDQFVEQLPEYNPELGVNLEADKAFVLSVNDYEERLERLRRITNENLYAIYLAYLELKISHQQLEQGLSDLAEQMLVFTTDVVKEKMKLSEVPIGIIGLGKLGIQAMGPKSDIDVVYLFNTKEEQQLANQFVSRLSTALHLQMREGRVYEMDDRLRPYGKSGSPTISISSFESYQNNWAKNWEHLALVSGRFITGNPNVKSAFEDIRKQVLSRPRQLDWFYADCADMLRMIREQRIKDVSNTFASKLISGGLMEVEYIINCLFIRHGAQNLQLFDMTYSEGLKEIERIIQTPIVDALLFLRKLQVNVRLLGHGKELLEGLPIWVKEHLIQEFELDDFSDLGDHILRYTADVLGLIETFFDSDVDKVSDWQLAPVKWLDVK